MSANLNLQKERPAKFATYTVESREQHIECSLEMIANKQLSEYRIVSILLCLPLIIVLAVSDSKYIGVCEQHAIHGLYMFNKVPRTMHSYMGYAVQCISSIPLI